MTKESHEFLSLLHDFLWIYHEKVAAVIYEHKGLKPACHKNQIRTLIIIDKMGTTTFSNLGRRLGLKKGSLTTLIDSLEKLTLVSRQDDQKDRRRVWLRLTSQGKEYLAKIKKMDVDSFSEIVSSLSPEEKRTAVTSLENLIGIMEKMK